MEIDVRQFSSDKILKHLDRINEWLNGDNPPPITVELDMTNICNHKCHECSGWYFKNRSQDYLPKELAIDIVTQLEKVKTRGLIFTGGGEPLCNLSTPEVVLMAKKQGLDIGFITNGSLINDTNARVLLKSCTWIRISLDAANTITFKKVHGLESIAFDNVVNNIKLLVRLKTELKSNTTIGIGYLTSDYTINEMFDMTKFSKDLAVDYLQFRPIQIHNNGNSFYHKTDIKEILIKCIKESSDKFNVVYSKHKYDMMHIENYGHNYDKCYGHQFATVIAADGKMYVCCHTRGNEKYCIGDLRKNSFEEIWNSKQRKRVAGNIDFNDCIPLCRDNTFNQILWNIKQPREHVNFL
jgi:radical SAM protein with 4Fe4S-binding SPASM domain